MDIIQIARQIKSVIENTNGCTIKTTPKKGEGFVPYNRFNLKWGQVDVSPKKIRIVLDLYPRRYMIMDLEKELLLPEKNKGDGKTGMFLKPTEKDLPHFDALEISLYQDFCATFNPQQYKNYSISSVKLQRSLHLKVNLPVVNFVFKKGFSNIVSNHKTDSKYKISCVHIQDIILEGLIWKSLM